MNVLGKIHVVQDGILYVETISFIPFRGDSNDPHYLDVYPDPEPPTLMALGTVTSETVQISDVIGMDWHEFSMALNQYSIKERCNRSSNTVVDPELQ